MDNNKRLTGYRLGPSLTIFIDILTRTRLEAQSLAWYVHYRIMPVIDVDRSIKSTVRSSIVEMKNKIG